MIVWLRRDGSAVGISSPGVTPKYHSRGGAKQLDGARRSPARAGLKGLAGGKEDFGPEPAAGPADRDLAIRAWRALWEAQK